MDGLAAFLGLYGLLWRAARPVLRRHRRLSDSFARRLTPAAWGRGQAAGTGDALPSVSPLPSLPVDCWIQAASGGEAFLVRRLVLALDALLREQGGSPADGTDGTERCGSGAEGLRLLCTSCTRQGLEVLQTLAAEAQATGLAVIPEVFPLDEPDVMRRALDQARPKIMVLLETELWPGLMAACAERRIPVLLLNGRMREKSLRGYRCLNFFWKRCPPRAVYAVSAEDAARFAALFGTERVAAMPNMKFDGLRLQEGSRGCLRGGEECPSAVFAPGTPVMALASVRREEEELLLPHVETLMEAAPGAVLVVAPRHMERIGPWREQLSGRSFPVVLRSELGAGGGPRRAEPGSLVLWDRFGELGALYEAAGAVFVGGSLAPLGGQNFLEAAAAGLVPCVGPFWSNFAWAGEEFFHAGLARRVASAEELARVLPRMLASPENRDDLRRRFAAYVAPRRGGSRQAAELLLRELLQLRIEKYSAERP